MKESAEISVSSLPEKRNKAALWRNLAFIVGIGVFTFMVYKIGLHVIWDNIKQTRWWFFAIIGVWGLVYFVNTIAWYSIIRSGGDQKQKVPFFSVMKYTISGYALNYVTPFGLAGGEPYRIMELRRYMDTERATASVILYAMMHVCSHFFFWLTAVVLIAWFVPVSLGISLVLTGIVTACLFLIFLFFQGSMSGFVVNLFRILGKLPIVGKKFVQLSLDSRERLLLIAN